MHEKTTEKMGQNADSELIELAKANPTAFVWKITPREAMPTIISKKFLCVHFGLQYPSGGMNYRRLYRLVLTPKVIEAIGMTLEEVKAPTLRDFDAMTSARLKQVLQL